MHCNALSACAQPLFRELRSSLSSRLTDPKPPRFSFEPRLTTVDQAPRCTRLREIQRATLCTLYPSTLHALGRSPRRASRYRVVSGPASSRHAATQRTDGTHTSHAASHTLARRSARRECSTPSRGHSASDEPRRAAGRGCSVARAASVIHAAATSTASSVVQPAISACAETDVGRAQSQQLRAERCRERAQPSPAAGGHTSNGGASPFRQPLRCRS